MVPPSPSPLPAVHRGRPPTAGLRERILAAAERIFMQRDYHEVLMDDVAHDCGVAKGTLYRYFPSKRVLCLAVTFSGIERLRDAVRVAVEGRDAPLRKIERIVECIIAYVWERRFFLALIHRNEHKPADPDSRAWARRRTEISRLIQRAFEEAAAAGEVRAVNPRIATEMLLGMLRGVTRYRADSDAMDTLAATVIDVFVRGVGTPLGERLLAGDGHTHGQPLSAGDAPPRRREEHRRHA